MSVLSDFYSVTKCHVTRQKLEKLASESHKIVLSVRYVLVDGDYVLAGAASRSAKAIF